MSALAVANCIALGVYVSSKVYDFIKKRIEKKKGNKKIIYREEKIMKYEYAMDKYEKGSWVVCRRCQISLGNYNDIVWKKIECPGLKDHLGNVITYEGRCTTDFVHYHLNCPHCLYQWTEAAIDIKKTHINSLESQFKTIRKLFPKFDEEKLLKLYREGVTKEVIES